MARREEIEFVIRPNGDVEEKVTGVTGPDCTKVTQAIENALGAALTRDLSGEYYQQSGVPDNAVSAET